MANASFGDKIRISKPISHKKDCNDAVCANQVGKSVTEKNDADDEYVKVAAIFGMKMVE